MKIVKSRFSLLCALLLLHKSESILGPFSLQSAAFQESAQVALLFAAIIPVCLEDMLPPDQRDRQGPSRR